MTTSTNYRAVTLAQGVQRMLRYQPGLGDVVVAMLTVATGVLMIGAGVLPEASVAGLAVYGVLVVWTINAVPPGHPAHWKLLGVLFLLSFVIL